MRRGGEGVARECVRVGKGHVVGWVNGEGARVDVVLLGAAGEEREGRRAGGAANGTFAWGFVGGRRRFGRFFVDGRVTTEQGGEAGHGAVGSIGVFHGTPSRCGFGRGGCCGRRI